MTNLNRLRLLVVDDNPHARTLALNIAKSAGIGETREAASGADAVTLLAQERFDAVLTDWYMPDISGAGVVKVLRDERFAMNKGVPVIVMTAYASSESLNQARALGVDDVLIKPLDAETLKTVFLRIAEATPAEFGAFDDGSDYFAI